MSDKIKNYLGIAIIISILVFAYSALQYANTNEAPPMRSFSVSGEGKVVSVPDIAQFTFSIITEGGESLADIQRENTTKTNAAIDFVKSNKIDAEDIKTERYSVSPRYQYYNCGARPFGSLEVEPCPPAEIVGYTITNVVSVKIRDFEKISDTISGVVENGANSVSSLSFTIDDTDALENEAREEAIREARAKAKDIAKAGGFSLGKIISINEGYSPRYDLKTFGFGGEAVSDTAVAQAPSIEPGSQDIVVNINVVYEIK